MENSLQAAFESFQSAIEKEKKLLEELKEQLAADKQALEEEKNRMQKLKKEDDIINLNVGGEKICTKRSTLCLVPNSMLAAMFSGRWDDRLEKDKEGNVFLDYNTYCFRKINDYLRAKRISTPAPIPIIAPEQKDDFQHLVKFLGLESEFFPINPADKFSSTNMFSTGWQLSKEYTCVTSTVSGHRGIAGTVTISSGVYVWRLKIVKMTNDHWIFLGIISSEEKSLPTTANSYSLSSCYGWAKNPNQVYCQGVNQPGHGNYQGDMKQGDIIQLKIDLDQNTLEYLNTTSKGKYSMKIPSNIKSWSLHVNFYSISDCVEILPPE